MKIKTTQLIGPALNRAVAEADDALYEWCARSAACRGARRYSENWSHGEPIIARYGITFVRLRNLVFPRGNENGDYYEPLYRATCGRFQGYGATGLIAAMRAFVASKLGDEVEVPDELLED